MSALRQEAIDLIQNIPETKIIYVVGILKNLSQSFNDTQANSFKPSNPQQSYKRLLLYKGAIDDDIDCKAELAQARDEKYADFI